jgi:predicted ATP-dependent serine protease
MEETSRVSAGAELVHTVEIGAAGRQGAWRRPLFEELASVHERSALYGQYFAKSGVKELDVALGGGLRPGQYIELRGRSGTGKSLLCNSVLSRNIHTFRIVYLDSENNHQCVDLVQTRLPQISSSSYYQLLPVFCIEDVLDVLRQTEAEEERRLVTLQCMGTAALVCNPCC